MIPTDREWPPASVAGVPTGVLTGVLTGMLTGVLPSCVGRLLRPGSPVSCQRCQSSQRPPDGPRAEGAPLPIS